MNYDPQNEQGLLGLVTALKAGMDPSVAYSMYQGIAQDQATQIANRQQRLTGLAGLLMEAAGGGATYDQASTLAEAQAGPAGPAVQSMLNSYYPYGTVEPGTSAAVEATQNPTVGGAAIGAPMYGGESVSNVYTGPDPMQQMAQQTAAIQQEQAAMELQQTQTEMALPQLWQKLTEDAASWKAQGYTPEEFIANATAAGSPYSGVVGSYPEEFQKIVSTVFFGE